MTLGNKIWEARKAKGIGQRAVADELGVTIQAVSQWERDKTVPSQINLIKLSSLLGQRFEGTDILQLPIMAKPANYAPLIRPLPTLFYGEGQIPDDGEDLPDFEWGKTEMVPFLWAPVGNVFALRIEDRSMLPDFHPGDIVLVDAGVKPAPGDFVVGHRYPSEGGLFRKYRVRGFDSEARPIVELVPINPDFPTITITDGVDGTITGRVREFRRVFGID